SPLKVATHGPVFRYERPQKGRYRQFHEIDAEIIGAAEPQADVELLAMADQVIRELGIEGITLHLNTLGDGETREAWRAALIEHFGAVRGELSEDSQERLDKNPLRILDSKDPRDRKFVADAPKIDAFLSDEARKFFDAVTSGLDAAGVKWSRAESLVRGLDYYRHTAFEFIPDEGSAAAGALGSQSTILGGGRYDGLMESLGGAPTPAVGWAAGIERLAMLVGNDIPQEPENVAVVLEDDRFLSVALQATQMLRQSGIIAELFAGGSRRKRLDKAVKRGADALLIVHAPNGEMEMRCYGTNHAILLVESALQGTFSIDMPHE
ncbi:MAG: histidine--tRNA ligase, partial [Erythrobacter sp.]|nr:histidine--tRNA ligase [Erythrobacter sp.]